MTVLSGKTACADLASVGLGPLDGMPPHAAHEPIAMMAAAPSAASRTLSSIVWPAIWQYTPPSFVGIEPSMTRTYLPQLRFSDWSLNSSACLPAPAQRVSW